MKKRIITISGLPGSGKSSTARGLAQALLWQHFSSGDVMRQMAERCGLSIEEMNAAAEKNISIDHEIDAAIRKMGQEEHIVIDSRTAYHWIPESFKVFLKIDPTVATERTFAHIQSSGRLRENADSIEEVRENMQKRTESEKKRYARLYHIDYTDESQYDLVVDTAVHSLHEVIALIREHYAMWEKKED